MNNIIPARPPDYNTFSPSNNWMQIAREILDETLTGFRTEGGLRPNFCYFTKPIKYKDTEVVQVFFANWTIHFQMSWHGTEEYDPNQRYGDLSEQMLISMDVETGGRKVPKIANLQRHILERITPVAQELLPDAEASLVEHHLVWEAIDFNPFDASTINKAAERLTEYVKALASPTIDAAIEWSETMGIEMQAVKAVMKVAS